MVYSHNPINQNMRLPAAAALDGCLYLVGKAQCLVQIMQCDKHNHLAFARQGAHEIQYLYLAMSIEGAGGFVHQQYVWVAYLAAVGDGGFLILEPSGTLPRACLSGS